LYFVRPTKVVSVLRFKVRFNKYFGPGPDCLDVKQDVGRV
jgi:hypothetical protein